MNRKGKKSSLAKAKKAKTNSKSKAASIVGKAAKSNKSKLKRIKPKPKAVADNSSRLEKRLTTKSNSNGRNLLKANSVKSPPNNLKLATYAITIIIGLSTIFGSLTSMASSFQTTEPQANKAKKETIDPQNQAKLDSLLAIASLGKEISTLRSELEKLSEKYPDLEPEIFVVDLDSRGFVNIQGKNAISSASTIKLPILVAFFQDVERGKIGLEEQLVMSKKLIAEGSGNMQYEKPGTKFSALETATRMMTISDNTATNMLIKRMGGMEKLNERFIKMGLTATQLSRPLPDLIGKNTTSSADLGNLLVKIDAGQLINLRSRDRLLYIMRNIARDTLLPQGLESEAIIAHKTGDIKSVLGDAGIIDMPNGKRYVASVLVKRPDNSPKAKEFIQKASGITYQYFKDPQTTSLTVEEKSE